MLFIPIEQQTVDIGAWGNPIHGLVEFFYMDPAGVEDDIIPEDRTNITLLKDGSVQPYIFRDWMDTATANLLLTGAPEVLRTPGEEASDEARGFEWRNDAIINRTHIYTKDFSQFFQATGASWPYVDSNGKVWKVQLKDLYSSGPAQVYGPNTLEFYAEFEDVFAYEFGNEIYNEPFNPNLPPEIILSDTVTLLDAGISDIDSFKSGQFSLQMMDYSQDGGKALVFVGDRNWNPLYSVFNRNNVDLPSNFRKAMAGLNGPTAIDVVYEVVITGVPGDTSGMNPLVITVLVFKDQETVYGNIVKNEYSTPNVKGLQSGTYTNALPDEPNTLPFARPDLLVDLPSRFANHTNINVTLGISEEIGERCQIAELDCEGQPNFGASLRNEPMQYFQALFPFAGQAIRDWESSITYEVDDLVRYNGQAYICIDEHVTAEDFEPGQGVDWRDKWAINWRDPTDGSGAQTYVVWAEGTTYLLAPTSIQSVVTTGLVTFTNVSVHVSTLETQPGIGEFGDAFWVQGGAEIAPGSPWEAGKIFTQFSLCTSIFESPLDGFPELGTFICLVPAIQSTELTKPFVGSQWRRYWQPQYDQQTSSAGDWEGPVTYETGDLVIQILPPGPQFPLTPSVGNQPAVFSATSNHESFDPDTNPNTGGSPWEELWANCRIGGLGVIWAQFAVNLGDEIADFDVQDQFAWGHYREDGTVKEYEIDVTYTITKNNSEMSGCWEPITPDPDFPESFLTMGQFNGAQLRGNYVRNGDYEEEFTWSLKVDGSLRHTVTIASEGVGNGQDFWHEEYLDFPALDPPWAPVGHNTLQVFINGVQVADVTNDYSSTTEGVFKGEERDQDFLDGITWEFMDETYLEDFKDQMIASLVFHNGDTPGGGMLKFAGGLVRLDPVAVDPNEHFETRPLRSAEQIAEADPLPTIMLAIYSPQLVGGIMFAGKTNGGIQDIFYQLVLEPSDFKWDQMGLYAPDAESNDRTSLATRQPLGTALEVIQAADYGDDISSCYDPRTKQIVRNSQKRVCFV